MGYGIGAMLSNNYDSQTMDANDNVYRAIILHELFSFCIKKEKR